MNTGPIHFLNGKLAKEEEMVVSMRDLGFMRGYAVFDFLITYPPQRPFMLDRHIDRLFHSAELIGLALPWKKAQVRQWVIETLAANSDRQEKAIKIVVSGGVSRSLLPEHAPTIAIFIDDRHRFPAEYYEKGVGAMTAKFHRYVPEAKSNNYIEGVKDAQAAEKIGAIEPVYYDDRQVLEGATSNVFAVIGGKLLTPKSNILAGVTRDVLLEMLPSVGIPVEARDFTFAEFTAAEEMFLAASNKEIMPVTRLDDRPVGSGAVGPVTKEAMKRFGEYVLSNKW